MQVFKHDRKTLAIVGAGPKGLAVAVKAKVLHELGLPVDRVILIERHSVAANWYGENGFTNGEMKLGTSPEKDLVYPIETSIGDKELDEWIQKRLMDFTWTAFLIHTKRYTEWIDRGRVAPCHLMWANYLRWVSLKLAPEVQIITAEVTSVDIVQNNSQWEIGVSYQTLKTATSSIYADKLMFTGPGQVRTDFEYEQDILKSPNIFDLESVWVALRSGSFAPQKRMAVVGAGENAASVLLELGRKFPRQRVEIISPKGYLLTRSENFYENQFYSDPDRNQWKTLSIKDRQEFVEKTDIGVFSVHAMEILNDHVRHAIIPGKLRKMNRLGENRFQLHIEYGQHSDVREYDQVILATGFDQSKLLAKLFSVKALEHLREKLGAPLNDRHLSERIDTDLSLAGIQPKLHLPMLAGINQGPGFANLSCLGRLSDRVILPAVMPMESFDYSLFADEVAT